MCPRSRGFTLVELLIALTLLTTLLLVLWSLFGSLARLDEKGSQQIERVQLLRGLQATLTKDLVSRYRPPVPADSSSVSSPGGSGVLNLLGGGERAGSPSADALLGSSSSSSSITGVPEAASSSRFGVTAGGARFRGSATSVAFDIIEQPQLATLLRAAQQSNLAPADRQLGSADLYGSSTNSESLGNSSSDADPNQLDAMSDSASPTRAGQRTGATRSALGRNNGRSASQPRRVRVQYRFAKTADGTSGGLTRKILSQGPSANTRVDATGTSRLAGSGSRAGSDAMGVGASDLSGSGPAAAADQVLGAEDLYRSGPPLDPEADGAGTGRTAARGGLSFPEIAEAQFRYHDGTQWVSSWDSEQQGGYPAAIELQFSLLTAVELRELREAAAAAALDPTLERDAELESLNDPLADAEQFDEPLLGGDDLYGGAAGVDGIRLPYRLVIPLDTLSPTDNSMSASDSSAPLSSPASGQDASLRPGGP